MPTSFASIADYEARYGTLEPDQVAQVQELLNDATLILISELGKNYDEHNAEQAARLRTVCRAMAGRAFASSVNDILAGTSQTTETAGPYSVSYSFSNPTADLFLTKQERKMLQLDAAQISSIAPSINPRVLGVGGYYEPYQG